MIVLDVESSGLTPATDSILSLGALDLENPSNQFYDECRVWDGALVHEDALAVNGFTAEEIQDVSKKTEAELIEAFVAWALMIEGDRTLAAQNPSFDLEFVQAACKRAGIESPFAKRTIDVHSLVWLHMTERGIVPPQEKHHSSISLDSALEYCGLPKEAHPHNALTGALSHAEVIARVAYTKKLLPDFSSFDIPWETNQ